MNVQPARRSAGEHEFGITLRSLMQRPTYAFTPGWLSKVSGIPKATIVNWLEGRVTRPRVENALPMLCYALRLTPDETTALYRAAGAIEPPIVREDRFFDRVPVGLYRTTPEGRILYANLTLVETLGYRNLREYLGLDVTKDLYAKSAQRKEWIAQIVAAGTLRRHPVRAKRADGSVIELLDSASAVRDAQGRLLYFEGIWEPT